MWIGSPLRSFRNFKKNLLSLTDWLKQSIQKKLPFSWEVLCLVASYSCVLGTADWFIERLFLHQSANLYMQWTIPFRPETVTYNTYFFSYSILVIGLVIGLLGLQLLNYLPKLKAFCIAINERVWGVIFGVSLLMTVLAPFDLMYLCFLVGAILYSLRLFVQGIPKAEAVGRAHRALSSLHYLVLIAITGTCFYLAVQAWYPVFLTNDYTEVTDSIGVPATNPPVFLSRTDAVNCILSSQKQLSGNLTDDGHIVDSGSNESQADGSTNPSDDIKKILQYINKQKVDSALSEAKQDAPCPMLLSQLQSDLMTLPLQQTGTWQSQAGRTLYHQSYVYVPAAHLLKYGLESPIPYLYGLGNTWFHSVLFTGKPVTLTTYFNMFPAAQLAGILILVACIFFITGNVWSIPAAFAAVMIPLFSIGYENIQLAPGFSPLRYAGLAVQFASIAFFLRTQTHVRLLTLIIALAFSFIWNKEFAMVGFAAPVIALLLPQYSMAIGMRILAIISCCVVAAGLFIGLGALSAGFLETIQVGIFGVAMPPMDYGKFLSMCLYVPICLAILVAATLRFEGIERAVRLCFLPVLCLLMVKYIYNASPNHLLYSLVFILPFALVYMDWNLKTSSWGVLKLHPLQRQKILRFIVTCLVIAGLATALHYKRDSADTRNMLVAMFQKNSWSGLGETFQTSTPAEPIETRMKAVQAEIRGDDDVLFLSPFDHLMSFYGNPKSFCGHFEYLTNLVTYADVGTVTSCARNNPHALVVYDDAVQMKCPSSWSEDYYDIKSCVMKKKLMLTAQSIMDALKPDLVLVKKVGPLSFYRHADAAKVEVPSVSVDMLRQRREPKK